MQVEVTASADWSYGLIERRHYGDSVTRAHIRAAYYAIIIELRGGHPNIWHMGSNLDPDPDAYSLDHPPLTAHFYKVSDTKVSIFAFKEQGS